MKKIFFMSLLILLFILAPTAVFADDTEKETEPLEPVPFEFITSDKDDFQPKKNEYSITFARKITINAESVKGAKVVVTVSFPEEMGLEPEVYEEVIIGASQKFIQPVPLKIGDNFIEISVEKEGFEQKTIKTVVKRKDGAIVESLQNLIVIPGQIK